MVRRLLPVLALLLIAVVAAASAQQATVRVPEARSQCVDCHSGDQPPYRHVTAVAVPDVAATEEPTEWTVTLQHPWKAELVFASVELDLCQAPSLRFAGGQAPVTDTRRGAIPIQPAIIPGFPPQPQTRYHQDVTLHVPAGATELTLTVLPDNQSPTTGPDLVVEVYPGRSTAEGEPYVLDNGTRGQAEAWSLATREAIAQHGYGNWTMRVIADVAPGGNPPLPTAPTAIPFTATAESGFASGGECAQALTTRDVIGPGKSRLFTFRLEKAGEPAETEQARLHVNVTQYHKHVSNQPIDEEDTTKTIVLGLEAADGGVRLVPTDNTLTTVVRPPVAGLSWFRIGEVVGYISALLVVASIATGGMFGKASRRALNALFGTARRRVAFHNVLSYLIIAAAAAHTFIFVVDAIESYYHWTHGLIWGGIAILGMLGLGVTGALQIPLVKRWTYGGWRWTHFGLALATILFTVVHMLLDGHNFAQVQGAVGWRNPFDPRA